MPGTTPRQLTPLEQVLAALGEAGLADTDFLRDAYWLAQHMPPSVGFPELPRDPKGRTNPSQSQLAPESSADTGHHTLEQSGEAKTNVFPDSSAAGAGQTAATAYLPAPDAIPQRLEFARSLRPFQKSFRSPRFGELDEAATAERSAELVARRLAVIPRFRPRRERWFSVTLLLDAAPEMVVWRETARAFADFLGNLGVFQNVHSWTFNPNLAFARNGRPASPRRLADPSGRTLIMILTHGVGAHWRDPRLVESMQRWARTTPVAICSLLPQMRWPYTDLGGAYLWARSPEPGLPNRLLTSGEGDRTIQPGPEATVFPVFPLTPPGLVGWAKMLMAQRGTETSAVTLASSWLLPPPDEPSPVDDLKPEPDSNPETGVAQRVRDFWTFASPDAARLLGYLAAPNQDIDIEIARIVQQTMGIEPGLSILAEVLLSGLLEPVPSAPGREKFRFLPEAKRHLKARTSFVDLDKITRAVGRFIDDRAAKTERHVPALVPHPEGGETISAGTLPVAQVLEATLPKLTLQPPSAPVPDAPPYPLYISYAPEDREWMEFLRSGLSDLEREGWIEFWSAEDTSHPGRLEQARVIIVLLSPAYASSTRCQAELAIILERKYDVHGLIHFVNLHQNIVDPRITARFPVMPNPRKAVTEHADSRVVFSNVLKAIRFDIRRSIGAGPEIPAVVPETPRRHKLQLFISYARPDRDWMERIRRQLASLENDGLLNVWVDEDLRADHPVRWEDEIQRQIRPADVFVVLLSADYAHSDYCQNRELPFILDRRRREDCKVYFVNVSAHVITKQLLQYQIFPSLDRSLSESINPDRDIAKIVGTIRTELLSDAASKPVLGPKVFLSYSQDPSDPLHTQRVAGLAASLSKHGCQVFFDQSRPADERGIPWPIWMDDKIEAADSVLLICTDLYFQKVTQKVPANAGLGVLWEANLIYNHLYLQKLNTDKFVPVVFSAADREYIPRPLRGASSFTLDSDAGYEDLYAFLTRPRAQQWFPEAAVAASPPTLAPGTIRVNPVDGLRYVWCPPGRFRMGASEGDEEAWDDEKPAREVVIKNGFWIGQTPVTQAAYRKVMKKSPSYHKGSKRPVEQVSWRDAAAYAEKVGMRLPTEAEWEYAARAGSKEARYGPVDEIAWYDENSWMETHEVGKKKANGWGLHDMLGNVWEWTDGWYDSSQSERPLRGGSYYLSARNARVSCRGSYLPVSQYLFIGFRCVGESASL